MKTLLASLVLVMLVGCSNEVAHQGYTRESVASSSVPQTTATCGMFTGGTGTEAAACPAGKTFVGATCDFSGGTAHTSHMMDAARSASIQVDPMSWECSANIEGAGLVTICVKLDCQ